MVFAFYKYSVYTAFMNITPFEQVLTIVGSKRKLAIKLGLTPMAISRWNPEKVPVHWCRPIELLVDGQVTREELRPDIFA